MSKKQDFVLFSGVRKKLINLNCLIKKIGETSHVSEGRPMAMAQKIRECKLEINPKFSTFILVRGLFNMKNQSSKCSLWDM